MESNNSNSLNNSNEPPKTNELSNIDDHKISKSNVSLEYIPQNNKKKLKKTVKIYPITKLRIIEEGNNGKYIYENYSYYHNKISLKKILNSYIQNSTFQKPINLPINEKKNTNKKNTNKKNTNKKNTNKKKN